MCKFLTHCTGLHLRRPKSPKLHIFSTQRRLCSSDSLGLTAELLNSFIGICGICPYIHLPRALNCLSLELSPVQFSGFSWISPSCSQPVALPETLFNAGFGFPSRRWLRQQRRVAWHRGRRRSGEGQEEAEKARHLPQGGHQHHEGVALPASHGKNPNVKNKQTTGPGQGPSALKCVKAHAHTPVRRSLVRG